MKTKSILLIILIVSCYKMQAQEIEDLAFQIKNNVTSFIGFHTNFGAEFKLNKQITANLQLRYRPMKKTILPPFYTTYDKQSNPDFNLLEPAYASFAVTPEIKFYSNKSFKGFYISAYTRYRHIPFTYDMQYKVENELVSAPLIGKGNFMMSGLMLGANFRLSNKLSMDIIFGGVHIAKSRVTKQWTSPKPLSKYEQQSLARDLSYFLTTYRSATYNKTDINGSYSEFEYSNVGMRAAGINLAYNIYQ